MGFNKLDVVCEVVCGSGDEGKGRERKMMHVSWLGGKLGIVR